MNTKQLILFGLMAFFFSGLSAKDAVTNSEISTLYDGLPFKMPKVETVKTPSRKISIKDIGAISNGIVDNGKIINKAIDSLAQKGGGSVVVPKGLWLTGPIVFKSNINLHLEKGALLLFSTDKDLYPLVETSFEGLNTRRCQSPISGKNLQNISITGEGVIDGNGDAWRPVKKEKLTEGQWKALVASGGVLDGKGTTWYPSDSYKRGASNVIDQNVPNNPTDENGWQEIKDFLRPVMVSFNGCKGVWLDGVTFQNSPAWCLHPLMCENVLVSNITVRNPWYSQNGDGIDLESCKNSVIYNSSFDVGDDAICVKSGKDADGRQRKMPNENLIVSKCVVYHGHGGFVVGSEMSGGVKNVSVKDCLFMGTEAGLRFKSKRGRGGIVENIYISNINMINIVTDPILFDLFYGGKSAAEAMQDQSNAPVQMMEVNEETPTFRNVFISDVMCNGAGRAMYINGLPEMNVQNVDIKNVTVSSKRGATIAETDGLKISNVRIDVEQGEIMRLINVKNTTLDNVSSAFPESDVLKIDGAYTHNVNLINMKLKYENLRATVPAGVILTGMKVD